jgi:phage baseplate assembly protein gpV
VKASASSWIAVVSATAGMKATYISPVPGEQVTTALFVMTSAVASIIPLMNDRNERPHISA